MIALLCFVLAILASPFKSKSRLEAENTALRYQLIVLRRQVRGRIRITIACSLSSYIDGTGRPNVRSQIEPVLNLCAKGFDPSVLQTLVAPFDDAPEAFLDAAVSVAVSRA